MIILCLMNCFVPYPHNIVTHKLLVKIDEIAVAYGQIVDIVGTSFVRIIVPSCKHSLPKFR